MVAVHLRIFVKYWLSRSCNRTLPRMLGARLRHGYPGGVRLTPSARYMRKGVKQYLDVVGAGHSGFRQDLPPLLDTRNQRSRVGQRGHLSNGHLCAARGGHLDHAFFSRVELIPIQQISYSRRPRVRLGQLPPREYASTPVFVFARFLSFFLYFFCSFSALFSGILLLCLGLLRFFLC